MTTLLLLAKAPRPGAVKTRLIPRFGPDGAAALAFAALADTLAAAGQARRDGRVDRVVLVLDGEAALVPPHDCEVVAQCGGDHAARIAAAFEVADGPALLIGMDTPQVTPGLLGLDLAAPADAWLGPAEDGGWWAMGLRDSRRDGRRVLDGVTMSTPQTGALQRERLSACGLRVADLPPLRDVDTPDDAVAVAALAPATAFAAAVACWAGHR